MFLFHAFVFRFYQCLISGVTLIHRDYNSVVLHFMLFLYASGSVVNPSPEYIKLEDLPWDQASNLRLPKFQTSFKSSISIVSIPHIHVSQSSKGKQGDILHMVNICSRYQMARPWLRRWTEELKEKTISWILISVVSLFSSP